MMDTSKGTEETRMDGETKHKIRVAIERAWYDGLLEGYEEERGQSRKNGMIESHKIFDDLMEEIESEN